MQSAAQQDYEQAVFPGFLRMGMAKWAEDGAAAPSSRQRSRTDNGFSLCIPASEADADLAAIEHELGETRTRTRGSRREPSRRE
mmetsp:Transcript_4518/g.28721  ORF Transcript_4518/g.28721 Transcript_4518/m.28721 type:complete len:84 (+) Transcript_4518:302-553(+)